MAFNGFQAECLDFFRQLARNNNSDWFKDNRERFDRFVLEPAQEFVVAVGRRLKPAFPGIHAVPKVNQSLFRLNRDTRFSKDKTPYKTHLALWFWDGPGKRMECPGFYFHLEPGRLLLGTGLYMFPKPILEAYRGSVVHPEHGPALREAIDLVLAAGPYTLGGKNYKQVPRGYDSSHPLADLLLYNGLHVGIESELPPEIHTPQAVDYCLERFEQMAPVHRWLLDLTERTAG